MVSACPGDDPPATKLGCSIAIAYAAVLGQEHGQGESARQAAQRIAKSLIDGAPRFRRRLSDRSGVEVWPGAGARKMGICPGQDFLNGKVRSGPEIATASALSEKQ